MPEKHILRHAPNDFLGRLSASSSKQDPLEDLRSQAPTRGQWPRANSRLEAYVVDDFQEKIVDLNNDLRPDISHGQAVSAYLSSHRIKINRVPLNSSKDDVIDILRKLATDIESGKKSPYPVNLSISAMLNIKELGEALSLPLTPQNLKHYQERIYLKLQEHQRKGDKPYTFTSSVSPSSKVIYAPSDILEYINVVSRLASIGAPVYTSAGNHGRGKVSIFSLSRHCVTVGGLDEQGKDWKNSSNSSLVSRKERSEYQIIRKGREVDITGDGKVDFKIPNAKSRPSATNESLKSRDVSGVSAGTDRIRGTSFSTPAALGIDLVNGRVGKKP